MSLKVELKARDVYFLGNNIIINITYFNTGIDDVSMHNPTTGGALKHSIFNVVGPYNGIAEYHGVNMKVQEKVNLLSPGCAYTVSVDLSKEYYMPEVGTYEVTLNYNMLSDSINNDSGVKFTVASDGKKVLFHTWFLEQSKQTDSNAQTFGFHHVYGATETQFNDLRTAHSKANYALQLLVSQKQLLLLESDYINLFGAKTDNWGTVYKNYNKMTAYFSEGMKYSFNGDRCRDNTYGYVFPAEKAKTIYLCKQYLLTSTYPQNDKSYDTKVGVILHELSHKAANTEDHFYGFKECVKFAKNGYDELTITNADCIQIFAELSYLRGVPMDYSYTEL